LEVLIRRVRTGPGATAVQIAGSVDGPSSYRAACGFCPR